MITYLTTLFSPDKYEDQYCLAIVEGQAGARLSHSHNAQYLYVLQSLSLWRNILDDFFHLWSLAEKDLLDVQSNPYKLTETGQGFHRLQPAPSIDKAMRNIIHTVQSGANGCGEWVGSSVIHLGDKNVPNALLFIDKYNQVGRILSPIVICLRRLPLLMKNSYQKSFLERNYGSVEGARKAILCDFFKYAFDGSGADNFFEAGSCIDGRLTSAWHWCNQLPQKSFFSLFKLTGFVGFDGEDWDI
jgi:hypothetical protein